MIVMLNIVVSTVTDLRSNIALMHCHIVRYEITADAAREIGGASIPTTTLIRRSDPAVLKVPRGTGWIARRAQSGTSQGAD